MAGPWAREQATPGSAGGIGAAPAVLFGKRAAALRGEVALGARWEPAAQDPPLAPGKGGAGRAHLFHAPNHGSVVTQVRA